MYCLVDVETTGLTAQDKLLEVAYVLWDTTRVIEVGSFLGDCTGIPSAITEINGIRNGMRSGVLPIERLNGFDFPFIAHNAPFDRGFLERAGLDEKEWIDTSVDIPYPAYIKTRKLTHLCAELGIPTNGAHCAVYDCLMMLEILKKFDIEEVRRISKLPARTIYSLTTYEERELPRSHGFRWDAEIKRWVKKTKAIEHYPFKVVYESP